MARPSSLLLVWFDDSQWLRCFRYDRGAGLQFRLGSFLLHSSNTIISAFSNSQPRPKFLPTRRKPRAKVPDHAFVCFLFHIHLYLLTSIDIFSERNHGTSTTRPTSKRSSAMKPSRLLESQRKSSLCKS